MDVQRFDALARAFGARRTRRGALARLVALGGLSAAALSLVGADAKKKRKKKCKGGKKKCGKRCIPKANCCGTGDCDAGEECIGGQCVIGAADCPAAANTCLVGVACTDIPGCLCFQRLEGGVRCVQLTSEGACDQCATDADCAALGFPPGSSCIRDDGPGCSCAADDRGLCAPPCGVVP